MTTSPSVMVTVCRDGVSLLSLCLFHSPSRSRCGSCPFRKKKTETSIKIVLFFPFRSTDSTNFVKRSTASYSHDIRYSARCLFQFQCRMTFAHAAIAFYTQIEGENTFTSLTVPSLTIIAPTRQTDQLSETVVLEVSKHPICDKSQAALFTIKRDESHVLREISPC